MSAAIFTLLLSGIAFAQRIDDIGRTLFVELLGMRNYPGSPFSGNIINDLIMFLIIPTIFIIFVVFILLGRLAVQAKGIRILLGVGIYLFIIAGGYYGTFALAAGPYFIFLIFILGLLYFIPSHFRVSGGGMPGRGGGASQGVARFENMSRFDLNVERDRIKKSIETLQHQIREAERRGEGRPEFLRSELARLQAELAEVETQRTFVKKHARKFGL